MVWESFVPEFVSQLRGVYRRGTCWLRSMFALIAMIVVTIAATAAATAAAIWRGRILCRNSRSTRERKHKRNLPSTTARNNVRNDSKQFDLNLMYEILKQ